MLVPLHRAFGCLQSSISCTGKKLDSLWLMWLRAAPPPHTPPDGCNLIPFGQLESLRNSPQAQGTAGYTCRGTALWAFANHSVFLPHFVSKNGEGQNSPFFSPIENNSGLQRDFMCHIFRHSLESFWSRACMSYLSMLKWRQGREWHWKH